jgi:hypothetical protein
MTWQVSQGKLIKRFLLQLNHESLNKVKDPDRVSETMLEH